MFLHKRLKVKELPSTTLPDGRRLYHSPIGDLESVTTILAKHQDKSFLDAWRKAVGVEEADRESKMATRHGSIIHGLAEKHLMNEDWSKGIMPNNKIIMKQLAPLLDKHISVIRGIEFPLWSKHLRTAGRADLICHWDNFLMIGDFKTSKQTLSLNDVIERGYFIQTTAYSIMLEERTGLKTHHSVIINIPPYLD